MPEGVPANPIPRNTIARLMLWHEEREHFLGTCFAFPSPRHFITARHCVAEHEASTLRVRATFEGIFQKATVDWIYHHPKVDLALLGVSTSPWASATPFTGAYAHPLLGQPFYAFGYPVDTFSADASKETDRLFQGYIQRLFYYSSPVTQTTYPALELNIACPAGLSGGPVFVTGGDFEVMGVVTENLESENYLDKDETITRDGTIERIIYRKVINYGIALQLSPYVDWIYETIARYK